MTHKRRDGYIGVDRTLEHIAVAEKALGKKLPDGAIVHHVNGIRHDNRNNNLVICPDDAYHLLLHQRMRALAACGNPNWRSCHYCHKYDAPENLYINGRQSRHRECFNAAWRLSDAKRKGRTVPDVPQINATV